MNRIYKVIWSKVKHQYVVVSELAHSNGKQSRTARKSLRSRIAALVVCGAIAAFGVYGALPTQQVFAAEETVTAEDGVAQAKEYQYVAIRTTENGRTKTYQDTNGKSYTYHSETVDGVKYWVRDGYSIKLETGKRYPDAAKSVQVVAYKTSTDSSVDEGLLKSDQIMIEASRDVDNNAITTFTGSVLNDVSAGTYVGATNEGGTKTPQDWNYIIQDSDGQYKDVTNATAVDGKQPKFVEAVKQADGTYTVNGKVVGTDNLYVIGEVTETTGGPFWNPTTTKNTHYRLGAFVTSDGEVYDGRVFGLNNEVLMTAKEEDGTYYSYWAANTDDPMAPITNMTMGQFNTALKTIDDNSRMLAGDDIKQVDITANSGENAGGTIGLLRRGTYNVDTGKWEGTQYTPGTITIQNTEDSGNGKDVAIKFSNDQGSFTVEAGSKVVANGGQGGTDLESISVNGQTFQVTGGKISGSIASDGTVSIQQGNKPAVTIGKVRDWYVTSGSINDTGTLTLNRENAYGGSVAPVTIDNVASTGYVDSSISSSETKITSAYQQYFKTNDNYVESGKVSDDGKKLTLTLRDNSTVDVALPDFTTGLSSTDYRLIPNPAEGSDGIYKPTGENGDIELTVEDAQTKKTSTVKLSDIASAATLKTVNNRVGDTQYTSTNYVTNGDNLTTAVSDLDTAIKGIDNNTIAGGSIGNDGKISLTQNDGSSIELKNAIHDWNVTGGSVNDEGILTLSKKDEYGGEEKSLTIEGVASTGYVGDQITANNTVITQNYQNYLSSHDKYLSDATFDDSSGDLTLTVTNAGDEQNPNKTYKFNLNDYVDGRDNYVTAIRVDEKNNKLVLDRVSDGSLSVGLDDLTGIGVSSSDYKLIGSGEQGTGSYTPNAEGKIDLQVKDSISGKVETVTLTDIASAATLKIVNNRVGDTQYTSTNYVNKGDNLTTAISNLDSAINTNTTNISTLQGQTIDGGYVEDGMINLTHKNDDNTTKTIARIDGLEDYTLQDGQIITKAVDENGNYTGATELTIVDKYDPTKTEKVTIDGLVTYNTKSIKNDDGTIITGIDYDNIRLAGENGTRITNLTDGLVDKNSTDAVNGSQLWETQQQIEEAQTEAGKHTTMTVNGGTEAPAVPEGQIEGEYNTDGNLQLKQTVTDGQIQYDVKLNDDIILGDLEGNYVQVTGTKGIIHVSNDSGFTNINGSTVTISADNGTGKSIVISDNGIDRTMSGLSNTTWSADFADQIANSEELQSVAATQGQLQSAIQQAGESATKSDFYLQNGTTNLGTDSEGNQITVSGQTTGYKADENGNIDMTVANENGEEKHVVLTDIASKTALDKVAETANKGWNASDGTNNISVKPGNTLTFVGDDNTSVSADAQKGQITVGLNDYIQLGDNNGLTFDGDNGTINATDSITVGAGNSMVTISNQYITGLANTSWTSDIAEKAADKTSEEAGKAATQGQLYDVYSTAVKYDEGTDFGSITLEGKSYVKGDTTTGTHIYNVGYANSLEALGGDVNKFGGQAVNVDYLNDTIAGAVEDGGTIANSDKHLVANPDSENGHYSVSDSNSVDLVVKDNNGNSETITIDNVAKADDVGNINDYSSNNIVVDGEDLATSVGKLDDAIGNINDYSSNNVVVDGEDLATSVGKLDDAIGGLEEDITSIQGDSITKGEITNTGDILLKDKDGDTQATVSGLTDAYVDDVTFENNTLTISQKDKYGNDTYNDISVSGIASTDDVTQVKSDITNIIGGNSSTEITNKYEEAGLTDAEGNAPGTLVDADITLNNRIQNVANTSYANDMYLNERINNVENRLGDVEERIDKVGAMAAAIANLRTMGYDPEAPTEIAVGVGQYKSETGLALGIFHYPNQDFMLSASISTSGDEVMGGIGATWKLGRKSAEERAKDEEERILAKAEEIKQAAKRAEVKAQADRHAQLLAEREAAGQPIRPVEEA